MQEEKEEEKSVFEKIEEIKGKPLSEYHLAYDSIGEGLEPIYFWVLDFMRDSSGLGFGDSNVWKYKDEYDAAVSSGYFGEVGTRAGVMQDRAMKIMGAINQIIKGIINLIYDLREFDIRLQTYDDLKSPDKDKRDASDLGLKALWMDRVDILKGAGSINMMAQRLEFVTLRDAFMQVEDEADADKIDVNTRVKRILKARINEYLKWKELSEKELRKRYEIEKSYLKSQVASLKYYTTWVKPYLVAAHKLKITNLNSPNIVNAFNNMELRLGLFGKKEIKAESVDEKYAKIDLGDKVYACVEVEVKFRTLPQVYKTTQASHYVHSGRVDLIFKSYSMTDKQLEELKNLKEREDFELINMMTEESLKAIEEDLEKYLGGEEEEKEVKEVKKKLEMPFGNIFKGFGQAIKPLRYISGLFKGGEVYIKKRMIGEAENNAKTMCYVLYDIFKKAHGMVAW